MRGRQEQFNTSVMTSSKLCDASRKKRAGRGGGVGLLFVCLGVETEEGERRWF